MAGASTSALIVSGAADFGVAALVVLTAIIGIVVALIVWRFGTRKLRGVAK